ncbi:MAG: hypothetical protein J6B90_11775 [Lachnospiraceae bacterium]|nr:hypothetical protein [Lachnospiraceae bacterium]
MNNSEKLDLLIQKFEGVDKRLDGIDARLDGIDARLDGIDARLYGIDARLDGIDARLDGVAVRLDNMETDIKDIKLTIENELRVNIQRIAEGHLDLDRKLREALVPNQEVEMLAIKVRMLDTDVKDIQKKIS